MASWHAIIYWKVSEIKWVENILNQIKMIVSKKNKRQLQLLDMAP